MESDQTRQIFHTATKLVQDFCLIVIGIFLAGVGLKGFLVPNQFIDGGVTGIALLLTHFIDIPFGILLMGLNVPFVVFGYFLIGRGVAIKTAAAIAGLAWATWMIPFPVMTMDKLLVPLFGGMFIGLGIGLCMRGGAVLDGTEIVAILVSRRTTRSVGRLIAFFNTLIFIGAAILINLETAMYAIITYMAAAKTVDFVIQGIEEYTGVTIISEKSAEIRRAVLCDLGKGMTIYQGRSGLDNYPVDILYTVATHLEVPQLINAIRDIDADAFIIQQSINHISGGLIKRRPLHQ